MKRKHETSWVVHLNFEGWVFGLHWKSCTGLPNWDATASTLEKSRGLAQIELHAGAALQLDLRLLRVCMLCCSLWNASYESHWRARLSFAGLSFARCTRAAVLEVPCARFRFPLPTTTAREALKDTDARGFKLESEFLSIQSTRRYFLKKWCVTGSGLLAETADFAAENFLIFQRFKNLKLTKLKKIAGGRSSCLRCIACKNL